MKLEDIKDPKLRLRVQQALQGVSELHHELKNHCKLQNPEPQPAVRHEPLAEEGRTPQGALRIVVRIKSFRSQLLDPDNLCPKSLIDGLRYAGLIPGDRPEDIELVVTQEKCRPEEERTEIELILT